jgi:hypothetical protein
MAAIAKKWKILSGLYRLNLWWDFNQTLQHTLLCTIPTRSPLLHKWPKELEIEKSCPAFTDQTTGWVF